MSLQYSVALVGDYKSSVPAHQAIPIALNLASAHHGVKVNGNWVATAHIQDAEVQLASYQGIWCVPASPYENMQGALEAIRFARERQIPFLGTCAGFQHALIEYAQNVLGMADTDHAETNPGAMHPLISRLACSLVETQGEIILEPGSLLSKSYGATRIQEGYHCTYGPNPEHEKALFAESLRVTARDAAGEVRGGELRSHRFFVGTLFQPERRALRGELPPLVREFVGVLIKGE
jgi:CTP synthase (UTP-ammonia lyase)